MLFSNLFANYFHVKTAYNGKQGLEILESTSIHLIVSDIMMPEMDGIEFCQTVKSKFEFCHIPVILLTARGTEESQIEGYNSGADGYISKPCNFSLLYAQIMNLLKKQERKGADFRKQIVFEVGKLEYTSMDESFIQRAIDCVNSHLGDCEFGQPEFVREMGTSRTVLTEKLKSLTGLTPSIFILNVRLTAACKLLEEQKKMRIWLTLLVSTIPNILVPVLKRNTHCLLKNIWTVCNPDGDDSANFKYSESFREVLR